jgi:hypothetical protein
MKRAFFTIFAFIAFGVFAENIPGTYFDLNNLSDNTDYNYIVAIVKGDIFKIFSKDLRQFDTDLKKKLFLESNDSKPYTEKLVELKNIIKNDGITAIVNIRRGGRGTLSNYDVARKGFWLTIGQSDDDYKLSFFNYIYDKLSVTEEANPYLGFSFYKIFLPCTEDIAVKIEGNRNLKIKLQMKIDNTRQTKVSAGGFVFTDELPVASSMKIIISDNTTTYTERNL